MISDVDNVLRELLLRELPLRKGEVDITFDQPKREWSGRLNKPTLNIYLYDLRENVELRGSEQPMRETLDDGTISLRRNPNRIDLLYLVTAWAKETQDEHRLLSAALNALFREPFLPRDLLSEELKKQRLPIHIDVAHSTMLKDLSDLWGNLDNELHTGIRVTVTLAIEPVPPELIPPVRSTEMGFVKTPNADEIAAAAFHGSEAVAVQSNTYYMVTGRLSSEKFSPATLKLVLKETGQEIALQENGDFQIMRLSAGEYHLDILANERVLKHQKIQVPSPSYEIQV